jgi:hypothetical protein
MLEMLGGTALLFDPVAVVADSVAALAPKGERLRSENDGILAALVSPPCSSAHRCRPDAPIPPNPRVSCCNKGRSSAWKLESSQPPRPLGRRNTVRMSR